ncbi:hypothetical protein Tco_0828483 [Tanacetum coccineum]
MIPIISTVQQTTTPIPTPTITTDALTVTTAIHESNALTIVELRVKKLEKDVSELKTVDYSFEALVVLQSYVPTVFDSYDIKVGDVFQKELQKHTTDLIHKYSLQHLPELTKKPTPTAEQESEKSPLEILKIKREQAESQKNPQFTIKNPANHRLYHALMEALIEDEKVIDKGVADTVKDHKKKHDDDKEDDDEDPPAGPNQGKKNMRRRTKESESSKKPSSTKETPKGKTLTKGSKTGKSSSAKEPIEQPIDEDPLTFNDIMGTPIDFFKYVLNGLKIENLTQDILLGPDFNLLKGTYKLDWNNLEGDRYMFDLSKPLPLQGPLGHRTVAANYFFNNNLEYLKTSDLEVTYTTSITKIKATWYEIKGIEDMVPTLWSTIKHAYDNDALIGIKHWGERRKLWYQS